LQYMSEHLHRYPGKFCALLIELVQGEGGFLHAPKEWYVRLFEEAKKAGLAIWVDEVQTFGRTGELFAYQKFGLHEFVDVVTVAKTLQAGIVLFTDEYNPKPGLVAGTFSGGTGALRAARRILEILSEPAMTGPEGKISKLSSRFAGNLKKLSETSCRGVLSEIRAVGGMIAFQPFSGTLDDVKAVLVKLFDQGVVAFYCGHGPILIRLLPPLAVMSETDVDAVCLEIERAMLGVKQGKENQK
ncbi:MAG: aminotransferase class III-fold pyridoxal phosphate-dependent enzyme, partial [Bdellovibrionota bacterium]